jgi:hypothetical protein
MGKMQIKIPDTLKMYVSQKVFFFSETLGSAEKNA